uniref:Uncharacterized protein n=1 Tax=Megaselia scalaris TaxID=36166 RepID=T1GKK1_MEGSC
MRQTCAVICRYYLTGDWKFINSDEIVFKRIMGGLSNYLYYAGLPNKDDQSGEPTELLLRFYGNNHDGEKENIFNELIIFTILSERNLGPKLLGVFPGGRIEEFLH